MSSRFVRTVTRRVPDWFAHSPSRQRLSRFSTVAAAPSVASGAETKASLLPRVAAFAVVSLGLGAGAGAYTLLTDDEKLFWMRDNLPGIVRLIAPVLGLPQEVDRSELIFQEGDDETGPTDIKQVVGDTVHVAVKMLSGAVLVLEVGSHETPVSIKLLALKGRSSDRVLDITVLDPEKAQELSTLTPEELGKIMNDIKVPDIPEVVNLHTLQVALELCRQVEVDLEVRSRLAQNEADIINLKRGIEKVEERTKVLKQMFKEEKKRQNVGLLASWTRRY